MWYTNNKNNERSNTMPPRKRTPEQFAKDKDNIALEALKIIEKHGLSGFTIRELSKRMNMSAANIYNYFYNKDGIYLYILTSGFILTQELLSAAIAKGKTPLERLTFFLRAFTDFGLEHAAYYQIMFSTQDPKSMDYIGTPIEELARKEKEIAMRTADMLYGLLKDCLPDKGDEEIRIIAIRFFCMLHGALNLHHTNILREMDQDTDAVLESLLAYIIRELE